MSSIENRFKATIGMFILTGIFILIEHYKGGVVSHHLLAREDLPEISNWWGLLTVPIVTWVTYSLINRRDNIKSQSSQKLEKNNRKILIRFLPALIFGISVSLLWELGLENVLQYFILIPFLVAVFKPIHFPEYLLGFVIGMIYTFGGILPIIIGLVIMMIGFIINKLLQLFKTVIASNLNSIN